LSQSFKVTPPPPQNNPPLFIINYEIFLMLGAAKTKEIANLLYYKKEMTILSLYF